jgi:transcriptional regulator with XRE-family HTH domain
MASNPAQVQLRIVVRGQLALPNEWVGLRVVFRLGDFMEIGRKLRELREGKDLSQGDIEERTGLLRCYLSRVENGHTIPAIETLEKLANALDVPFWQLFHDGNTKATPLRLRMAEKAGKASSKDQTLESEMKKRLVKMNPRDRKLFLFLATKMALAAE